MIDWRDRALDLSARWIRPPGQVHDNYTFLARKKFVVDRVPSDAILHVAADTRYVVYLNGKRVGQGPARGTDLRYYIDSYDVAAGLCAGENHLTVRVHCPVHPMTSLAPPVEPAVLLELDSLVHSDKSWQTCLDPAHRADAPMYTHHIGYSDYRDLRKEPIGWETFSDDYDGWLDAHELADANNLGGRKLDPRSILPLTDQSFLPTAVIDEGCVPNHYPDIEDDIEYAALMQMEMHYHLSHAPFDHSANLLQGQPVKVLPVPTLLPNQRLEGAYILLNWQRELCGNLIIDVEGPEGTIIDVGYDEAIDRGRIDTRRVNPNGAVFRFADRYILREGRQRIETRLHERGMSVLQLVFRRFEKPVTIHRVEIANQVYPIAQKAEFDCDLPLINKLYTMCVNTVEACSLDVIVDCPWREQTLWIDDMAQEGLFWLQLTGDSRFIDHNLRISADGTLPNGQIVARYPSLGGMLLPVTSVNWITTLRDNWFYSGDTAPVRELLPVVENALKVYKNWRNDDGLVPDQHGGDMWNFIDWGYGDRLGGITAALNISIANGFKMAAQLNTAVGHNDQAAAHLATSKQFVEAVFKQFWDDDEKHLYDCTEPVDGQRTFSQIPHALGIYADLFNRDQCEAALKAIVDPKAIRAEYGYQLYVLDALVRNGQANRVLNYIEQLWAHKIKAGSPTVWEVYDGRASMTGCGSLCHAFAAYPLMFAQSVVLGVRPLQPAFAEFSLYPQAFPNIRRAQGTAPTPHGLIHVAWSAQDDQSLLIDVTIPDHTTAILAGGQRLAPGQHKQIKVSSSPLISCN